HDHLGALPRWQAAEAEQRHLRLTEPGPGELRPEGDDQQDWQAGDPIDRQVQPFARRGIDPMCIFEDEQHRLARRQSLYPHQECPKRLLLALLWGEVEWRVAVTRWQRQQISDQWGNLAEVVCRLPEHHFELVQPFFGRVLASDPAARSSCLMAG